MNEGLLQRWLAFGQAMQKAGSELPRHLVADTQAALSAQQQTNKPVAYGYYSRNLGWYGVSLHPGGSYTAPDMRPLYAAPPRAQLLRVAELVREECRSKVQNGALSLFNGSTNRVAKEMQARVADDVGSIDLAAIVDAILAAAPKPM